MRNQIVEALATKADIATEFVKAVQSKDLDMVTLLEKVIRCTGVHFDQSEDAVTKLDVKSDNKTELSGSIEFVLPEKK